MTTGQDTLDTFFLPVYVMIWLVFGFCSSTYCVIGECRGKLAYPTTCLATIVERNHVIVRLSEDITAVTSNTVTKDEFMPWPIDAYGIVELWSKYVELYLN